MHGNFDSKEGTDNVYKKGMKRNLLLCGTGLLLLLMLAGTQLSAQEKQGGSIQNNRNDSALNVSNSSKEKSSEKKRKSKKSKTPDLGVQKDTVKVISVDSNAIIERKQYIIDSLSGVLQDVRNSLSEQRQKVAVLQQKNDSLTELIDRQYESVLHVAIAMLYRSYKENSMGVVWDFLLKIPDSLKDAHTEWMLEDARNLVGKSNVSQDVRDRVVALLRNLPREVLDQQAKDDIKVVLSDFDKNNLKYNPIQHVVYLLNVVPDSVRKRKYEKYYSEVCEMISVYSSANEEIKKVLKEIEESPQNTDIEIKDSYLNFVNKIKNTDYYKKYYIPSSQKASKVSIYYLNDVIDEALDILKKANEGKKRARLKNLIESL